MSLPQQKIREIVFLLIYSSDLIDMGGDENVLFIMEQLKVTKKTVLSARDYVVSMREFLPVIDSKIRKHSTEYRLERICRVELNILRLGLYELFYQTENVPPKVALAEAIRLSRKFATRESADFVNAILDAAYREKEEVK
ncbi:MAG: transcription antitermination factor NusB [Chlamydiota bacterium]